MSEKLELPPIEGANQTAVDSMRAPSPPPQTADKPSSLSTFERTSLWISSILSMLALAVSILGLWFQIRTDDDLQLAIVELSRSEGDRTALVELAAVNQGNRNGVLLSIQPWLEFIDPPGGAVSVRPIDLTLKEPIVVAPGDLSTIKFRLPLDWPGYDSNGVPTKATHRLVVCLKALDSKGRVFVPPIPVASLNFRDGRIFTMDYYTRTSNLYVNSDRGQIITSYGTPQPARTSTESAPSLQHCMSTALLNNLRY